MLDSWLTFFCKIVNIPVGRRRFGGSSVCGCARGKGSFRGVACSPEAKPVPSGAAGNTVDQDGVKPCKGKPFDVPNQLELEGQKGNPGLRRPFVFVGDTSREAVELRGSSL